MPSIVAFTPSFAPRQDSESLVNTRTVQGLQKAGLRIEVLSRRSGTTPETRGAHPNNPHGPRYHTPLPRLRNFLRTLIGNENAQAARFIVERAWGGHMAAQATRRLPPAKCGLVLSFGGFCHIAALNYADATNIPIIANWNDPFPSLIAPPPYGDGPNRPLPTCYGNLLTTIGCTAAWHIFPSERLRSYMLKFLPKAAEVRSSVIPHIACEMPPQRSCADGRPFTITHAGGLLPYRRVDVFFEGLSRFLVRQRSDSDFRAVFIGSQGSALHAMACRYGVDQACQFLPEMDHERCARQLADSDALLVIEAQMRESIFLPTKFVDYAQTRKPILAVVPKQSTIADLINNYGGGVLADCFSAVEVAAGLDSLCSSWQPDRFDAEPPPGLLHKLFSEETVIRQYTSLIGRVSADSCGTAMAVTQEV